jgi:Uma2 family endonuclease
MATRTLMSAEEFDRLPEEEGRRYELLDGELIEVASATPGHNIIQALLLTSLVNYFLLRTLRGMAFGETDFALGANRRLRPDIAVLLSDKWANIDRWSVPIPVAPDIAVEIVSPSESAYELNRKVRAYLDAGTAEVWVIYPVDQHMYVHTRTSARLLTLTERLDCSLLPGWSIAVSDLFASL